MNLVTGTRTSWLVLVAVALTTVQAFGMGEILGETKEQLKLEYDLTVYDHGTGRVTITIKIADEGRMKPLRSVDLHFPSDDTFSDGGHMSDLSLSIATTKEDGKLVARAHLRKDWARRAEIWLSGSYLDGKQLPLTSFHHIIPVAKYMANTPTATNSAKPISKSSKASALPAAQTPKTE